MRTSKSEYRYKTVIKRCFFGLKKHLFLMRFFAKKAFDCVYKPQAPSRVLRLYFYFAGLFPRLCTPKEKRKMKKLLSLLLCAALCVSAMTACGSNQADTPATEPTQQTEEKQETEQKPAEEKPATRRRRKKTE